MGFIPKTMEVKVGGILSTGMYDKDYVLVYMDRKRAEGFFKDIGSFSGIEVYLSNPYRAQELKQSIQNLLGKSFIVRSWIELNRPLFNALELEKLGLFFVLLLMVFVASFNITSLLFMKVKERVKDIAIMKTYGVESYRITLIFLSVGITIGMFGAFAGVVFSYVSGYFITEYRLISVPEDMYMMSYVPVYIRPTDTLMTVVGTFLLPFVSSLVPSLKASRERVIDILRHE
jgi:lipoprotein-releasing system permease protein